MIVTVEFKGKELNPTQKQKIKDGIGQMFGVVGGVMKEAGYEGYDLLCTKEGFVVTPK